MKKLIFKITGLVVIAVALMYNVTLFNSSEEVDISFSVLDNVAIAQGEAGGNGYDGACWNCWSAGVKIRCWSGGYNCVNTECSAGYC